MKFLRKLQSKFGKYAIKNLTRYIIGTYIVGYIILAIGTYTGSGIQYYLALNPGAIMRGEIWRLITWILMPPSQISLFTALMLFVYYQLGTVLEHAWGAFYYNLYIFFGMLCTVIGAFIIYYPGGGALIIEMTGGTIFSTYYVSLSIFLGFAMTFPNQQMLLFFIIPIRIKWLALVDVAFLIYSVLRSSIPAITLTMIISSLAAVIITFFLTMDLKGKAQQKARSASYQKKTSQGQAQRMQGKGYIHKCAICGRTEKDDPTLEFRYCTKCRGGREYCQHHLFTHEHV